MGERNFCFREIENPKGMWSSNGYWYSICYYTLFLCNVVYLSALSRDEIAFAANDRVAVAAAER